MQLADRNRTAGGNQGALLLAAGVMLVVRLAALLQLEQRTVWAAATAVHRSALRIGCTNGLGTGQTRNITCEQGKNECGANEMAAVQGHMVTVRFHIHVVKNYWADQGVAVFLGDSVSPNTVLPLAPGFAGV